MSYSPNIPQATDNPSDSQSLILANYQQINTQFGTDLTTGNGGDHVFFTASSGNGSHNRVKLLNQGSSPVAVIQSTANQVLIFSKTQSGITMPYYTRDNIAAATTTWPLSPIKAYASVNISGPNTVTFLDSFNFSTVTTSFVPTTQTVNFTLSQACRTNAYGVLTSIGSAGFMAGRSPFLSYIITANPLVFQVLIVGVPAPGNAYNLTVTVLET